MPDLGRGSISLAFDNPGLVVAALELEHRPAEFLDGVEGAQPQQVLLHSSDEALGAAVALRRAHEGGRTLDAEKGQLLLKGIGDVLRAVVVLYGKPASGALSEGAEALAHALPDRLQ